MNRIHARWLRLLAGLPLCLPAACGTLDIGNLAAFLGPSVTVVIDNETSFTAVPILHTSDSHNSVEDLFTEEDRVSGFGFNDVILSHQSATIRLRCADELELILFDSVEFREGNGFPIGKADADVKLRRDRDFDCGDVIHIRLGGTIFNFFADAEVEPSSTGGSGDRDDAGDEEDDIGDFLEELFD